MIELCREASNPKTNTNIYICSQIQVKSIIHKYYYLKLDFKNELSL